ncbi:MAG: LysE family transporter [Bacteroidales bacterium]|nr:LysE family transporter [Bacteroidales bacterium]
MFTSLLEGMLVGLPFLLLVGPALFAILQTSMSKGFYSGLQLALGIALSDLMLMFFSYFGLIKYLKENSTFQLLIGLLGSIFLFSYGIYLFIKTKNRPIRQELKLKINWLKVFSEITKGFFLNIMNPLLWISWFAIVAKGTEAKTEHESIAFMLGIVIITFSTDILKSYFANKISIILSPSVVHRMNKILGIILVICAICLCYSTLTM